LTLVAAKVITSTHDLGEARRMGGDIVLLHRGRVIESANTIEFLNFPKTDKATAFLAGELLV
jgi:tungstate transport system ATP-binding protein